MSDTIKLGQIITGTAERDAIHIAVAPVTAGQVLVAGQHVGLCPDTGHAIKDVECIGIVDPFLQTQVYEGMRFYLWLYPNTVTGMRHHWQHPAFGSATDSSDKAKSVAWLQDAAVQLGVAYDMLVEDSSLTCGDYINNGEHIRDTWYDLERDFWKHRQIVTGEDVPESSRGGFTCSC